MDRLSKAEQNKEILLKERPDQRGNILAWKRGAALFRAVVAHEAGNGAEFTRLYTEAASTSPPRHRRRRATRASCTGGSFPLFADRLPAEHRAAAWQQAYAAYSYLWKGQGSRGEQLPVHLKGELLPASRSHRSGPGGGRKRGAHRKTVESRSVGRRVHDLTCKNCHNSGRLAARVAALGK
jgi:hypothetical protein